MSNKKQKKDPNRIPKTHIVPPVSTGIKPNEVPTVNEDLFQLIVKYAERHPSDLRDKERNLAYYIRLHQMLQNSYTELLITHQKMLSYNQLMQQDRIDMLFLVPPHILPQRFPVIAEQNDLFYADAENGTTSTPYSTGELTLPDKPDEFFYLFLPCFQKGVLQINEGRFNYFEIQELNLDTLTGIFHLFIRFGKVFGVGQLYRHGTMFPQKAVQAGNRTCVAALTQFDPEYNNSGVRIPAAHIQDQFGFFRCMLIWMAVGTMGSVCQRLKRSIVTLSPTIDILPVQSIPDSRFCHAMFH